MLNWKQTRKRTVGTWLLVHKIQNKTCWSSPGVLSVIYTNTGRVPGLYIEQWLAFTLMFLPTHPSTCRYINLFINTHTQFRMTGAVKVVHFFIFRSKGKICLVLLCNFAFVYIIFPWRHIEIKSQAFRKFLLSVYFPARIISIDTIDVHV